MGKVSLFLIFNLILLIVLYGLYLKLKKGNRLKTVAYYLFPTFTRSNRFFGKVITIVVDLLIIWKALSFELNYISILSNIITIFVIIIIVDWTIYVFSEIFITIHKYILWKFKDTWYFVFVSSIFVILFENFIDFTDYPLLYTLYRMESILLLFFGFIYICNLTINIITNKVNVYPEIYIIEQKDDEKLDDDLDKFLSIIAVISIQIIYFTSLLCVLINRNVMQLELSGEPVYRLIDMIYFVIITYTSVGYGDILPSTTIARIVVCGISITGFITSVAVIGEIIGMYSSNKSEDKK